ncbi:methylenetetrahydrofolate reductase [NAD(P)H] [Pseudonocardia spinosispora]|uniref:methylenetetrahydrofolate reductase [NAD(P)H] n=1 Tax=Pseudonocardia spinosispora TaxID=103441 RepID=UPI000685DDA9|nr:methylenetetrahydrofolate reductase [NAD(P)H] [Pseudonocardia spinosispora]
MGVNRIADIYARPGQVLSIEFWPPKTERGEENLFQEIKRLTTLNPAYCSMTYGAGGSTRDKTVELVCRIEREFGIDMMCHLTVVDQSRAEVMGVLDRLREGGVRNIIALGGDPAPGAEWAPHPEGYAYAHELVTEAIKDFSVAVAGFPEVHPRAESRESDLRFLKAKVDAGACAVITQLFFDNNDFYRFVEDARRIGIDVPIVPGMMPIRSAAQIQRIAKLCGARIPSALNEQLESLVGDDEAAVRFGIDYTTEQCQQLLAFGVPGFHFYALNKADAVLEIHRRLYGS